MCRRPNLFALLHLLDSKCALSAFNRGNQASFWNGGLPRCRGATSGSLGTKGTNAARLRSVIRQFEVFVGYPIDASGARILNTLLFEMK
ncbi:hypothetical protein ELG93_34855 [Rhizobium ruizarguesonis]|nr:hypothetical protein ELG93_34855 [Rhizobium ruizarguesonis]